MSFLAASILSSNGELTTIDILSPGTVQIQVRDTQRSLLLSRELWGKA